MSAAACVKQSAGSDDGLGCILSAMPFNTISNLMARHEPVTTFRKVQVKRGVTFIEAGKKQDSSAGYTLNDLKRPVALLNAHAPASGSARLAKLLIRPQFVSTQGILHSGASSQSTDLFNSEAIRRQASLWKELFFSRQRRYGIQGAREVWDKFRSFHVLDLPNIYADRALWEGFTQLALQDEVVRLTLVRYVREVYDHLERKPPSAFYLTMIGFTLGEGLQESLRLHNQLKFLEPSPSQLGNFVVEIADDLRSITFRDFCNDIVSFKDMYGHIVPALCHQKGFEVAFSWHTFLLGSGHNATFNDLALLRQSYFEFNAIVKPFRAKDRNLSESKPTSVTDSTKEVSNFKTLLHMLEHQIRFKDIPQKRLSDETCARFFATRFFSVDSVISGLRLISIEEIGPLALRALLNRVVDGEDCDIETARKHLEQLDKGEISLNNSRFCQVVKEVINGSNSQILYDIITCDLHSDTFEDVKLQSELLDQYAAKNDRRQINRTLAILTTGTHPHSRDTQVRNLLLQAAITIQDEETMHHIIDEMRQTRSPITHRSRQHMVRSLVMKSTIGRVSVVDLFKTIEIWKDFVAYGSVIDPFEWCGILRLIRMAWPAGMYPRYIALLTWLSSHYRDGENMERSTPHRLSVEGRPKRIVEGPAFWAIALPGNEVWEFLRWSMGIAATDGRSYHLLQGNNLSERVHSLSLHPILAGVRLLAELRAIQIPYCQKRVGMACMARLKFMYGQIGAQQRAQRRVKRFRTIATMDEYILAIETIWGGNVFNRRSSVAEFGEWLQPLDQRKTRFVDRDYSHFRPATEEDKFFSESILAGAETPLDESMKEEDAGGDPEENNIEGNQKGMLDLLQEYEDNYPLGHAYEDSKGEQSRTQGPTENLTAEDLEQADFEDMLKEEEVLEKQKKAEDAGYISVNK
ncbi:hypothetical protein MMC10_006543 [Thelotrema lepadinum]|nr:hypothetical protein [Thelotrema lepadinum]